MSFRRQGRLVLEITQEQSYTVKLKITVDNYLQDGPDVSVWTELVVLGRCKEHHPLRSVRLALNKKLPSISAPKNLCPPALCRYPPTLACVWVADHSSGA